MESLTALAETLEGELVILRAADLLAEPPALAPTMSPTTRPQPALASLILERNGS